MTSPEQRKTDPSETLALPYEHREEIGNTIQDIVDSANKLEEILVDLKWEGDAIEAAAAYKEVLMNAAIHGNLELQKEPFKKILKEKLGGEYDDSMADAEWEKEIDKAAKLPENSDKKSSVRFFVPTTRKLIVEVQDNGKNSVVFWENGHAGNDINAESLAHPTEYTSNRGFITLNYFLDNLHGKKKSIKNERGVNVVIDIDLDRQTEGIV